MAIEHVDITDPEIHEPKGASTANAGEVYVADGSGSGSWAQLSASEIDTSGIITDVSDGIDDGSIPVVGKGFILAVIPDISTASSVLIPIIDDCTIVGARLTLGGAIATADASVSLLNSSAASMGTPITAAFSGSAKGTSFNFTATGNNVLTGPTWMEIATDGASDNAVSAYVLIEYEYTVNG